MILFLSCICQAVKYFIFFEMLLLKVITFNTLVNGFLIVFLIGNIFYHSQKLFLPQFLSVLRQKLLGFESKNESKKKSNVTCLLG